MSFRDWTFSVLKVATSWIPGLGTAVDEALKHAGERRQRRSALARVLDVEEQAWRPDASPAALLRADFGVVPFHGRESELDDLARWCDGEAPVALRLYTAPGGYGKTRLLRHFVRIERNRSGGWDGGLLRESALEEHDVAALFDEARKPLLIVLDYAESRHGEITTVVKAARESSRERVRIVLLARSDGDWWEELNRAGNGVGDFFQGSAVEGPISLAPLSDSPELRSRSYRLAAREFADRLKKSEPGPELPVPSLDDHDFRRVLLVHAAALAAVEDEQVPSGELLDWLLSRERRGLDRVRAAPAGLVPELSRGMEHAAVLLTLAQGADSRAETVEIIARAPVLADQPRARLEQIAEALHVLYRGRRWCDGVEPDLLGEHLVGHALRDAPELLHAAFDPTVPEALLESSLAVLNRLAQRQPAERRLLELVVESAFERIALPAVRVAVAAGDPVGLVLAEALELTGDLKVARRLDGHLPFPSVALSELAVQVEHLILLDLRESSIEAANLDEMGEIGRRANNLSVRLAELGRREDALDVIREAVQIYRDLEKTWPDAFRPDLAESLNNLSRCQSDVSRREEAEEAIREAVQIRRELAAARPTAFRHELAASLNNLSVELHSLGRRGEALEAVREAAELYREFAAVQPDKFRPYLAQTLNNLSSRLSDFGLREQALEAIHEAVQIRRELAAVRPDAFQPDLAQSLNNLSNRLSDFGLREQALNAIREAVQIRRELAAVRPEAFRPDLAQSLINLSIHLAKLGGPEEALEAIQESVQIYRELAAARPDAFRPDLAWSMRVLHGRMRETGNLQGALDAAVKAMDLLEPFLRRHPAAFAGLMEAIANDFEKTAIDCGVEPDEERLRAIREVIARVLGAG